MRLLYLSYALSSSTMLLSIDTGQHLFYRSILVIHLKNLGVSLSSFALDVLYCSQWKMNGLQYIIGSFAFALFLSIRLSVSVKCCSYKIILIFSMSNENIIIDDREYHPINHLHVSK